MNNQIPYFMPKQPINNMDVYVEIEKLTNKLNRLEKNLRILENKINNLENNHLNSKFIKDDPTDLYII